VNVDLQLDSDGGVSEADGDITFLTEDVDYEPEMLQLKQECEARISEMEDASPENGDEQDSE
jgi:hypothetical protein